jgi:hypothetical protein
MSFGSTITLTVNSVAKVLNRINQDNYGSEYALLDPTEEYRIKIRHSRAKGTKSATSGDRHNIEVTHVIYGTSPAPDVTRKAYIVLTNESSDNKTSVEYLADAFLVYLASGTVIGDTLTWQS